MTPTLWIRLLPPLGLMTRVSSFKEASSSSPLNTQAGAMSCSALGLLLLLALTYAVTESSISLSLQLDCEFLEGGWNIVLFVLASSTPATGLVQSGG